MKGKNLTIKHLWGGVALAAVVLAVSCADGFESDEKFVSDVTNTTLVSPDAASFTFSTYLDAAGQSMMRVNWPLVKGAGGYLCHVDNVNDPENPVEIVADTIIDGLSVDFPTAEITSYKVSVRTMGNAELNNKDAAEASLWSFVPSGIAVPVPANEGLGQFIANYLAENAAEIAEKRQNDDFAIAFDFKAGQSYTIDETLDFGLNPVLIRSVESNAAVGRSGETEERATFIVKAPIVTQSGLRLQNLNLDCTDSNISTLIALSDNPDDSVGIDALGYKDIGADRSECWYIEKSIILENCWVKNLPNSLIYCQKKAWAVRDFRIMDCIIQVKNAGSSSFLRLDDANPNNTIIKDLTIRNSTIYNTEANSSAYFIRYANASNARPDRMYGTGATSEHRIENCTIVRMFSKKDFANNMLNNAVFTQYITNCVFVDVYRLYQYLQSSNNRYTTGNTMWYDICDDPQGNDTGGRQDTNKNPYTTEENPGFGPDAVKELDFDKPNGGVNFHATGAISAYSGDPRWR